MANPIKYNTGSESRALNKGNWWIGTGDVGKGPTASTGFWNGYDVPEGGYIVYLNKASNGPSIYALANDTELISLTNRIAGTSYTTVNECFTYFAGQDDKMVVNRNYESIVTDGLVMNLDAGFIPSYPRNGNTWYDLSGNGNDSSLVGVNFNSNYMSFPGTGERDSEPVGEHITLNTSATTTDPFIKPNGVTYNVWMRFTGNQITGHGIFYGNTTTNHIEYRGSDTNTGYWRTEAVLQNGYSFGAGSSGGHPLDEWFNLTIVFANNENNRPVRWYTNGEIFHTGDMTSGNNPSTEYFKPSAFGKSTGNDTYKYVESFKGDLSNLQIYNRALTTEEVLQNYNAQKSRFGL